MQRREEKNLKEKFVKRFNDSIFLNNLLTRYSGAQRVRFCEVCYKFSKKIIWSKDDRVVNGQVVYSHRWLCEYHFYMPLFKKRWSKNLFVERFFDA